MQFVKFFINGVFFGLLAWGVQLTIYTLLANDSSLFFGVSSFIASFIILSMNFIAQKKWIFKSAGVFKHFLIASVLMIILISILSPLIRDFIAVFVSVSWADIMGYPLAAVISSLPSFLLQRHWVFREKYK